MTSEVALLNRSAVALAADSAATVRSWERDHYENYYFKGTNKIFQLSATHPVGVMIYATASLQGAPWEVLIKSYRDQLKARSHDYLAGYATDLFDYIASNTHIFPADIQEQQFKRDVDVVAMRIVTEVGGNKEYSALTVNADQRAKAKELLDHIRQRIASDEFVGNAEQSDLDGALAKFSVVIKTMLDTDVFYDNWRDVLDFDDLARLAIHGQFKSKSTALTSTGIVLAGFGDKEYFPQLASYRCFGLILGKLLFKELPTKSESISQTNQSAVVSFAQDNHIQTFIWGASNEILIQLEDRLAQACDSYLQGLLTEGVVSDNASVSDRDAKLAGVKRSVCDVFSRGLISSSFQQHTRPFRNVLASLPFDELAELAHTLVLLEPLKERVTSSSASISGPIDVALISKNDGFVWIKRKHYFDPKLNPRYFTNRSMPGGGT